MSTPLCTKFFKKFVKLAKEMFGAPEPTAPPPFYNPWFALVSGNNLENFMKFHWVFQKLDHLTCNTILRINQNLVNGL